MIKNKFRKIPLSAVMLAELFMEGEHHFNILQGLPADAKIMNVQISFDLKKVILLVWSDSFDEIKEGEQVPEMAITAESFK